MVTPLIASFVTMGAYKCAITLDPQVAYSADKQVKVVVLYEGKFMIYGKGTDKPKVVGKWGQFGHHQQVVMSRDGSAFAIFDVYGGMEVYGGSGKRIASFRPENTLTHSELDSIPGKWACHSEGTWLQNPKFEFKRDQLEFTIYNGRKVEVLLK